jgi:predicted DNA binding CopG/RHH family protein
MSLSSDCSAAELGELASSVSRLLTACLGSKRAGRLLALSPHDQFLLDNATGLVEDVLAGLHFLAGKDAPGTGTDKIALCNYVVQTVLNKQMGTDKDLRTTQDLQSYFQAVASVLIKVRESGTITVTEPQLALAQRFFLELANTLPFEQRDDETRITIAMEEVLLRELKRVAQEEGVPVPRLVAEIILSHLAGSKASATAGGRG